MNYLVPDSQNEENLASFSEVLFESFNLKSCLFKHYRALYILVDLIYTKLEMKANRNNLL